MNKQLAERIVRFIGLKIFEVGLIIGIIMLSYSIGYATSGCSNEVRVLSQFCGDDLFVKIMTGMIGFFSLVVGLFFGGMILYGLWQLIRLNWEWAKK